MSTPILPMVEGGLYRNLLGAELRLIEPAYVSDLVRRTFETLAPGLWVADHHSDLFGPQRWLITPDGLAQCGYTLVAEEGGDE